MLLSAKYHIQNITFKYRHNKRHQREIQNEDNPTMLNKPRIESNLWTVIKIDWEFLEDL